MDFDVAGMRSMLETAWDRVTVDMTGGGAALAKARRPWIKARAEGADTRHIERELEDGLLRSRWHWPWHQRWLERFTAARMWPSMWNLTSSATMRLEMNFPEAETAQERRDLICDEHDRIKANAVKLFTHTVSTMASTERDRRQHAEIDTSILGWSWTLSNTMDPPALVEALLPAALSAFDALYPAPNTPLPPYFPGDMTSVLLVRPQRSPPSS